MAETESEEAIRLRSKVSEMLQSPSSIALPASKEPKSSYFLPKSLTLKMTEAESEEAVRLRSKASEMLQSPSRIALPASKEPKSSYFLTQSLAEMVIEDPIRLQNQSCEICEEIVKIVDDEIVVDEQIVYSSLARLPTFSIGLSSTQGESPPRAPLRESRVDVKEKNSPRYFQMPELGAGIFVGNVDGCDTVTCRLVDYPFRTSEFDRVSENAAVRSFYEDDRPGGLSSRFRGLHVGSQTYLNAILSGTELVVASRYHWSAATVVGNLRGKGSSVSGSSSAYKDCIGDESIIRRPSDTVEQPRDLVPCASYDDWMGRWKSVEGPYSLRSVQGSYLKKPKFRKGKFGRSKYNPLKGGSLQLTRFDDFVVLGHEYILSVLSLSMVIDIVRKNASETADVIAAQLVKSMMERDLTWLRSPITFIVILLDHKEILLRERKKEKKENVDKKYKAMFLGLLGLKGISRSTSLKDDKKITELKEEEKITFKEKEQIFHPEMEDKKGMKIEEDYKEEILVGESLPNVPQISTISLQKNEIGVKSTTISSNLPSATVQDDSEASSSVVLIEDDDCKSKDLKVSHHITKWIIYGDLLKRTLLCFFNVKEMQFEFYFEDHKSMATIIGLGVPHSKVILECGSPHVTVVEIPKEDWDAMWAYSNGVPFPIPEGYVFELEQFPCILHHIANVINLDNIVSKANNGGVGGDNGKGMAQDNTNDSEDKSKVGHDHDDYRNIGYRNGGSNNNDKKGRKDNDGNDVKKNQDYSKASEDCKEVQVVVHLRLLPGGVLKKKNKKFGKVHEVEGKKKKLGKVHEEEVEEKNKKLGEVHEEEGEGKQKKLGKIHEEEGEEEQKKLGEIHEEEGEGEQKKLREIHEEESKDKKEEAKGCKGVRKKKKNLKGLWHTLKRGENGNVVRNQQEWTTIEGVEDSDVDDNLQKQLDYQIHSQMVFTFTIKIFKDEVGEQLKTTIQATIDPITFQLSSNNEDNYMQNKRFGWFHEKLQVAFGVVNTDVAFLDAKSCKVLDSSEAKEVNFQSISKENATTSTNAIKGKFGVKHGVIASGEYGRTNGSEAKTSKEVHNSWETNKPLTKGGFSISEHTNLNFQQLKYSYLPLFPFKVKEFELKDKDERLKMYENQICQLQRVSCEGTWHPDYDSKDLEKYKLEASRELGITRIYNLDLETGEEKKKIWKKIWKVEKNLALCFIQKLEKEVYLNHAMSHLTRVYHLQERQDPNNSSRTFLTQAQRIVEPQWPSIDPLVDVKQKRNI